MQPSRLFSTTFYDHEVTKMECNARAEKKRPRTLSTRQTHNACLDGRSIQPKFFSLYFLLWFTFFFCLQHSGIYRESGLQHDPQRHETRLVLFSPPPLFLPTRHERLRASERASFDRASLVRVSKSQRTRTSPRTCLPHTTERPTKRPTIIQRGVPGFLSLSLYWACTFEIYPHGSKISLPFLLFLGLVTTTTFFSGYNPFGYLFW